MESVCAQLRHDSLSDVHWFSANCAPSAHESEQSHERCVLRYVTLVSKSAVFGAIAALCLYSAVPTYLFLLPDKESRLKIRPSSAVRRHRRPFGIFLQDAEVITVRVTPATATIRSDTQDHCHTCAIVELFSIIIQPVVQLAGVDGRHIGD